MCRIYRPRNRRCSHYPCIRSRCHSVGACHICPHEIRQESAYPESLYHHFRKHRMRRSAGGRGAGIPFPCTPFLYRRRHGRNYLSRIGIHTTTDTRTPYQTRLPVGFTRRIHPTCLPERQDGLKSGRGSGRPYCIHLCGNP